MYVMEGVGTPRGWTGLTAALVATLGALAVAPSAWADGDMPTPSTPVAGDVGAGEVPDVEALVSEVAAAATTVPVDAAAALAASDTGGDTAPDITDSAQESGAAGDAGQPRSAVTVQADAANINVSVRIDSAGDDAAVTQSNTAAAATQPTRASSPARSAATEAQPAVKSPSATSATSSGGSRQTDSSTSADGKGTWQWTWDCASPPDVHAPVLRDADGELLTWNWTWIWNCGANSDETALDAPQYQSATGNDTTFQYQPANVNVAIRISSPGNNGPVNQSNVAIGVSVPSSTSTSEKQTVETSVQVAVQLPAVSEAFPLPGVDLSSSGPIAAVVAAVGELERWNAVFGPSPPGSVPPQLTFRCGCVPLTSVTLERLPAGPCSEPGRGVRRLPGSVRGDVWLAGCLDAPVVIPPCRCLPPGPPRGTIGAVGAKWASGTSSSAVTRVEATRVSRTNRAKPARDHRAPQRAPVPTGVSGAALGAAPAGSSSGGALPISLLIPIVVALLDLTRRVAVTKVTLPTGLRGGTFDPPG
jgi:hypothetical protein